MTAILLGVVGPAVVVALVAVHFATSGSRPDREERGRARSMRAHARDLALGPAQLADLSPMRELEETTVAIDRAQLAALFRRQDQEVGEEYVRRLEARLAASFGLIELEGVGRR